MSTMKLVVLYLCVIFAFQVIDAFEDLLVPTNKACMRFQQRELERVISCWRSPVYSTSFDHCCNYCGQHYRCTAFQFNWNRRRCSCSSSREMRWGHETVGYIYDHGDKTTLHSNG